MTLLWYLVPLLVLAFGIESVFRAVSLPSPYIEHEDILAELDREFPAALVLSYAPCVDCACSGYAGSCTHRHTVPAPPSVPMVVRLRLLPGVVQINDVEGFYLLDNGCKVTKEAYHTALNFRAGR